MPEDATGGVESVQCVLGLQAFDDLVDEARDSPG
jgi:hypothetical protein